METEIIKVINIKTGEAINTVKELKKYVEELTDDLVKTDKTSQEYADTLNEIAKAQTKLTEVKKDAKNAMNYEDGSYKALNQELVRLKNEYRSLSEEQRNNVEVGGKILTRIQELDSELKDIDATMGQYQRNVGNYKSALDGVNNAYKNQRQELRALRTELEGLIPGTQEYNDAFNRAAQITHNLAYQQEMLKYSSADLGDQLSNLRGITANMVAGFSAINAAMGLFGQKNEDVQKAMLKVQQTMALVQGLSGMDTLLKRTKGLSTAMKVWFTTTKQVTAATQAQTVATKANTTATNAQTVSTNAATVATKGLNAALKANPIGAVLTAVLAFTAVIKPLIGLFEKLSGKTQRIKEEAREAEDAFNELNKTISLIDKSNRLEIIKMRLQGISELKIAFREWGMASENVNTYLKETYKQADKVNEIVKESTKSLINQNGTIVINRRTLTEMGYTLKQTIDLEEEAGLIISDIDEKQKKLAKNKAFKIQVDYLLEYVENLKELKKIREDADATTKEKELEEQAEAKRIYEIAEEAVTDERILLKRRYETNKELLEKYHFDTTALTKKYYKDLKELNEKYKIEPEKPVNMNFTATGLENIKKQLDDFYAKYKKNSLEILTYEYNQTVKTLNKAKKEEYKYFQDLYDEGKITAEQLAEEKARIDETYIEVKKQLDEKYRLEYKDEELALAKELFDKKVKYATESAARAAENMTAEFEKVNAMKFNDKKMSVNIVESIFGIDKQKKIEEEQEYMDKLYKVNKKGLEDIRDLWEQRKNDETLDKEERLEAQSNFVEALRQLGLLDVEYEKQRQKTKEELVEGYVTAIANAINTISDLFATLADTYQSDIDEQLKHNKISNKEAEKQYNKKVKPMMVAQATIQMLQGMVAAFAGAQQLGPIAGPIVGAALATAVGAMGALNIAKIQQTNPYSDSSGSAAAVQAPSTNYDYQPAYVQNTTGQNDVENLRNALTEQPIRAYVLESDISDSQKRTNKRNGEASF